MLIANETLHGCLGMLLNVVMFGCCHGYRVRQHDRISSKNQEKFSLTSNVKFYHQGQDGNIWYSRLNPAETLTEAPVLAAKS